MTLDREDIEAIAVQVVTLLERGSSGAAVGESAGGLVDAAAVARELRVERDWVYTHASALGAIRLGGPRGRLRFDLRIVKERLGAAEPTSWRPPRRASRRPVARERRRKSPRHELNPSLLLQKRPGGAGTPPGLTPGGSPMQHNDNRGRGARV